MPRCNALVTDPPRPDSTTWKNPPICDSPLYIDITSEPIMSRHQDLRVNKFKQEKAVKRREKNPKSGKYRHFFCFLKQVVKRTKLLFYV